VVKTSRIGTENWSWFSNATASREFDTARDHVGSSSGRSAEAVEPRLGLAPSTPVEPTELSTWPFGPGSGVKSRLGDHDALLGFGLIAAYCVVALVAMLLFPVGHVRPGSAASIVGVTLAIDSALLALIGGRLKGPILLCFPILLIASELALSLLVPGGEAAEFTGFLTLMFVFIGLTQGRRVGPVFVVITGVAWAIIQRPWTAQVGVKLFLALAIWLIMSQVLAVRTERARIRTRRLVRQVNTDVLTGLGSRLFLSDRIERAVAQDDGLGSALLFIDLDGFKRINDTYGHSAGDELLVAVARRVKRALRLGDVAARLGGDEFVVLLAGCSLEQAVSLAQDLLASLSEPFGLSVGRVAITASMGIVNLEPSATAELALRRADRAMGEAKSAGRNQVFIYEAAMEEKTIRRIELETQLRDAVANDQFEVHYQPVVHSGLDTIIGAEALIRWRHPERGLLTPDEFLSVSEDIGLMGSLGDWVLRQACLQAQQWQSIDPARAFSVAVNLSAPEMFSADLIGRVRRALEESGLPGKLLVLEITERIMMSDMEQATRQLGELRKLGVRIAIDDFGTGYSSLAYVRDLPVDILKIDRNFVAPLGSDHQALALVRAIVGIANALDLDVIVEGAETAAQIELLNDLGCQVIQGFYFGRPTSSAELQHRLMRSRASSIGSESM
jgi:diguanylate cyclase (GGDEF)-like protein